MKRLAGVCTLFLAISGCSASHGPAAAKDPAAPASDTATAQAPTSDAATVPGNGVAVLELFTSESCSSCPPAEANLARIVAARDPQHVIALAFHVSYWNNLGWVDPFSSPAYTARQQNYAQHGVGGVYTPELVVNGSRGLNGAREAQSDSAIDTALSSAPSVSVHVALTAGEGVAGRYTVSGAPSGAMVDLALLQRNAVNAVSAGENAGETLHQVDVVRAFQSLKLDDAPSGSFSFALPDSLSRSDVRVTAVVQDANTLHILGGAATP
jgi:hypothetical protein